MKSNTPTQYSLNGPTEQAGLFPNLLSNNKTNFSLATDHQL